MTNPNYIEQEWQSFLHENKSLQALSAGALETSRTLFFMGASALLHVCNNENFNEVMGDFVANEVQEFLGGHQFVGEVIQ